MQGGARTFDGEGRLEQISGAKGFGLRNDPGRENDFIEKEDVEGLEEGEEEAISLS